MDNLHTSYRDYEPAYKLALPHQMGAGESEYEGHLLAFHPPQHGADIAVRESGWRGACGCGGFSGANGLPQFSSPEEERAWLSTQAQEADKVPMHTQPDDPRKTATVIGKSGKVGFTGIVIAGLVIYGLYQLTGGKNR